MWLLKNYIQKFFNHFSRLSWQSVTALVLIHFCGGYLLCLWAEQTHLIKNFGVYFHFWIVTISTVGFGDLYPNESWKRIVVDLWFIGLGLGLFGAALGKAAELVFSLITRHVKGMKNFSHLDSHIIIFCNDPIASRRIIELMLGDKNREPRTILLCSCNAGMQHPMPEASGVEFAFVDSFIDPPVAQRIAIAQADKIIVNAATDEQNLSLTIYLSGLVNQSCHIATHFDEEVHIQSLNQLKLNVECSTSKQVEQLVRATQDNGSTAAINQLLDTQHGETLFVLALPKIDGVVYKQLKNYLYDHHDADAIGLALDALGQDLDLLPAKQTLLSDGKLYLHYVCKQRIDAESIDWQQVKKY